MHNDEKNRCIAITGMACRFSNVSSNSQFWQRLGRLERTRPFSKIENDLTGYAKFGVPPIYRFSINRIQLPLFELARDALSQAGLTEASFDPEFTDVILCTGFGLNRGYENFNRLYSKNIVSDVIRGLPSKIGGQVSEKIQAEVQHKLTSSSHDKVGEMASTLPSRIANFFKLRGRAFALESSDTVGAQAITIAVDALRSGKASAVLLLSAQGVESELIKDVLQQAGVACSSSASVFDPSGCGGLSEGACAMLLTSCNNGDDKVLAYIGDLKTSAQGNEANESLLSFIDSHVNQETRYIDLLKNSVGQQHKEARDWLSSQGLRHIQVGSVQNAVGYGFANATLASVCAAVQILMNKSVPAGMLADDPSGVGMQPIFPDGRAFTLVAGTGLFGEHFSIQLCNQPLQQPQILNTDHKVAVVSSGAHFGRAKGLDAYWKCMSDDYGSIRALAHQDYGFGEFKSDSNAINDSYYIDEASFISSEEEKEGINDNYIHKNVTDIVVAVAAEAARSCRLSAQRTLCITATNLSRLEEKRAAYKFYFPRFKSKVLHALDEYVSDKKLRDESIRLLDLWVSRFSTTPEIEELLASQISQKISGEFSVHAQNVAIESACAGSLAAVDTAVNALVSGRIDVAIVSGVELPVNTNDLCLCSSQRMLTPEVIATFTDAANGFTPGDGAGVLVLKRVDPTCYVDNQPLGYIASIAGCTESKSVIAPNESGQIKAMQRALQRAQCRTDSIEFIEIHGTGTKIGDQVEINSLYTVYQNSSKTTIKLGALKTRFGHMFAAAGCASIIKILQTFEKNKLPSNLIRGEINQSLQLDTRCFDPLCDDNSYQSVDGVKRASINSFGTGGVNYHMILESVKTLH